MSRKPYKRAKRGAGRHVQLPEYRQASPGWATMKPGPLALYIELKRRFNGSNNSKIRLSHREAATALNVHRNTVGPYFVELQKRGFIRVAVPPCLGPSGVGETAFWTLEEAPTDDQKPARKSFMSWPKKQNPRTKNRTPRHSICDTDPKTPQNGPQAS